jgi:hypothetical protein
MAVLRSENDWAHLSDACLVEAKQVTVAQTRFGLGDKETSSSILRVQFVSLVASTR